LQKRKMERFWKEADKYSKVKIIPWGIKGG
jgi:hypothetical protein